MRLDKLEKQQTDLKDQQVGHDVKLKQQSDTTTRLETQLQEQKKVDDSIKQTIATLETELRAQQLDHQTRLKEQEDTKTRLERMIQQQEESTKCTLGRIRGRLQKGTGRARCQAKRTSREA